MSDDFPRRLIDWQRRHGRRDLPWQSPPTPYRVWISEVMLQQTQVGTVIGYFERFMQRFPDVQQLAAAPLDEVLHHWSGLGYYARARNLHRAARTIVEQHGGEFPTEFDAVLALPGIGRSTAGAILALSGGQRHAILDGNAKRVLARHAAIPGWPGRRAVADRLWEAAESYTPDEDVAVYTQAIMDLGATVCVRRNPRCEVCPVAADCRARTDGNPHDFPGRKPRGPRRQRDTRMLMVTRGNAVLLERRPDSGIWGGLWSFPELGADDRPERWCRSRLGGAPAVEEVWPVHRHSFTHFDLDIVPILLPLPGDVGPVGDGRWLWYTLDKPVRVGLAAPVAVLLDKLRQLRPAGPKEKTQ